MRLLILCIFFIGTASAQHKGDEDAVKKVIQTYFDGYAKGDSTILGEAFHPSFKLSWVDPWRGRFQTVNRSGMYRFFSPNWRNLTISSEIKSVTVYKQSAYVTADVTLKGIVRWFDLITLLKVDSRWWIVSKVSEGESLRRPVKQQK